MAELRESDTDRYQGFTRLTVEVFDELLSIVKVDISGSPQFRLPILADMRLAVTLRYLEKVVRDWLIRPETVLAFAYFSKQSKKNPDCFSVLFQFYFRCKSRISRLDTIHECDGRTDGQTDARRRLVPVIPLWLVRYTG